MKRILAWLTVGMVSLACVPVGALVAVDHWTGYALMAMPVLLLLVCGVKFLRVVHTSVWAAAVFWVGVAMMVSWKLALGGLAFMLFVGALRRLSDAIAASPIPADSNRRNDMNITTGRPHGWPDSFDTSKDYGI